MKIKKNKAFTLIELMIVISIISLLLLFSYAPYNFYQSKAKVRIASREVAQSLYEAKNMAISWVTLLNDTNKKNKIVAIFMTKDEEKNNQINYYFVDFWNYQDKEWKLNESLKDKIWEILKQENLQKTKKLQNSVLFKNFEFWNNKYNEISIIYAASSWNIKIFWKENNNWKEIKDDKIWINISFKNTDSDLLNKKITYYIKTNIVDYN